MKTAIVLALAVVAMVGLVAAQDFYSGYGYPAYPAQSGGSNTGFFARKSRGVC